jgi:hypothetical protein
MGWKEDEKHENFLKKQRAPSERLDDWLTVHRSNTLVDLQLEAQILIYLHIIHLLKSSTSF